MRNKVNVSPDTSPRKLMQDVQVPIPQQNALPHLKPRMPRASSQGNILSTPPTASNAELPSIVVDDRPIKRSLSKVSLDFAKSPKHVTRYSGCELTPSPPASTTANPRSRLEPLEVSDTTLVTNTSPAQDNDRTRSSTNPQKKPRCAQHEAFQDTAAVDSTPSPPRRLSIHRISEGAIHIPRRTRVSIGGTAVPLRPNCVPSQRKTSVSMDTGLDNLAADETYMKSYSDRRTTINLSEIRSSANERLISQGPPATWRPRRLQNFLSPSKASLQNPCQLIY
ncbi:hypothetical protein CYMTET_50075 [Cymbomonas tetramitiformis]|uniref:Uncharacterized protein n=1 Tax=Cymbomonas tetramitiformis TaxID=36881 RepID=A0AAE0ETI2_9CHLO|nr:hypothetical protein CYMTET_50075 [Cymbomonas tetramitiformis]